MNIALKNRRKVELNNFRGFDFSSSRLNVLTSRGHSGKNLIYSGGVNRKRNGYEEIFRVHYEDDDGLTIYPEIDGIFKFTLDNNEFTICYAGRHFFRIEKGNDEYKVTDITYTSDTIENRINPQELSARKIALFRCGNKVYFVGAGKYISFSKVNDNYQLRYVKNDYYTYTPTTTINIQPDGEETQYMEEFEDVNVMTGYRKNELIPINVSDGESVTYTLDSGYINLSKNIEVSIKKADSTIILQGDEILNVVSPFTLNNVGSVNAENGKVTLRNISGILDDAQKITVLFLCEDNPLAEYIDTCQIGTLFGVNGRMDRLFVSKTDLKVNSDYYSECDEYSYFTEYSESSIGNNDSKIMAYNLLNDGTLAIQKEYKNGEAGIYFRTGIYDVNYSSEGLIEYINTYFPLKAGTIGEGVISSYASANLGEDKLFLSRNGVFSIRYSSGGTSVDRYSRERSKYINGKLLKEKNLENAVAIVYKNKYYLAVNDNVYIADSIFKNYTETTEYDSYNYEWWFWDNIPCRFWQVIDDELYFGTDDGRVCIFDKSYTDKVYEMTQNGDILIDYSKNKMTLNADLGIKSGVVVKFRNDVFETVMANTDIKLIANDRVYLSEERIKKLYSGMVVMAISTNDVIHSYREYTIQNVNYEIGAFSLYDENGELVIHPLLGFSLVKNLRGKKLKIVETDTGYGLSYIYNEDVLRFTETDLSAEYPLMSIMEEKNVVCEWYTPMMDLGSNESSKTLLKISVTTEPVDNGKVTMGYRTKDSIVEIEGKGLSVFNFDNFSFTNFSFTTSFANSYTIDVREDFNYIQFYFRSDTPTDCIVQNITLIYKENRYNKGVE